MSPRTCLAIILAAGEGTRMRSQVPKVLHALGGRSLLGHVIVASRAAGSDNLAIVVGPDHEAVRADVHKYAPKARIFEQRERRGTAHAVLAAREAIARGVDDVVVMFGDTPLVQAETLSRLRGAVADGAAVINARHRLMHPGLVNAHTHGPGNLGKGLYDRWSLELLLTASQWVGIGRTLDDKYLSAKIGAAEMLLKGCTAAYDLAAEFPVPSVEGLSAMESSFGSLCRGAVPARA